MKKVVLMVAYLIVFLPVIGQVIMENSHDFPVRIVTPEGQHTLNPKGRYRTTLLSPNKENTYTLHWAGNSKEFTEDIGESLIIDVNRNSHTPIVHESRDHISSPVSISTRTGESRVIKNSADRRFQVISSEFPGLKGLSLAPGQESDSVRLPQGLMHLSLLVDLDADSVSTGRRYMQQVFTQIVAQNQKLIEITNNHLYVAFAGREKVRFIFQNTTPYDLVGAGGGVLGVTIPAGGMSRKRLEYNDGFLNATWQYLNEEGVIRQFTPVYTLTFLRRRVEVSIQQMK